MPFSMKINTAEVFQVEGSIGAIREVKGSDGKKKTKIPLENFSGFILVDNDAPTINNSQQGQATRRVVPQSFDPCATPKEQLAVAGATGGGG